MLTKLSLILSVSAILAQAATLSYSPNSQIATRSINRVIRRDGVGDTGPDPQGWNTDDLSNMEKSISANTQLSILTLAYPEYGVFVVHNTPRAVPVDTLIFKRHIESLDPGFFWDSTYGWDSHVVNGGTFTFSTMYNQDYRLGGRYHQYQDNITFCPIGKSNYQVDTANWMTNLDGSLLVTGFTIPGTHDSAAQTDKISLAPELGATQSSLIPDQLLNGIRFFDLRLGSTAEPLKLRHGLLEIDGYAQDVFLNFHDFLAAHPNETILCSVKWDYDGVAQPADFETKLNAYFTDGQHGTWYTSSTLPKLDDVRGKIVLLRRYNGNLGFYMDVANNNGNHTSTSGDIRVQDLYSPATTSDGYPDYNTKWNAVQYMLDTHLAFNSSQLNVNFLSAVNIEGLSTLYKPSVWANEINARMQSWLDTVETQTVNLGVVAMDFPDTPSGDWDFKIKEAMMASGQTLLEIAGQVEITKRLILTNFA
ncbi:hypothetical protein H072_97 [Dactylellina haptotyla CBS 200.50]|uniref:Phosphatidylinositol-specific phospholipase C X domain-containing protein n=1 Tax=Dactylellina haptotyla (strain CBS 200.50) TaxID=1284197 RepID=S8CE27_DACHA|nr:hypothetical protein H072_97 [Dactylellina haptotyla CBS 200.50]